MKTFKQLPWIVGTIALATMPWSASAQSIAGGGGLLAGISNEMVLIFSLIFGLITLLSIFLVLAYVAYSLLDFKLGTETQTSEEKEPFWAWFWDKFNAAVPQSKEQDALLDHDYDGIQELDNDLPPWWKYGFYMSIVFAVLYIYIYHVGETESVSVREYYAEVKEAEAMKTAYLARMETMIDESNATTLVGAGDLGEGKAVYMQNCRQCHGAAGEGGVGPNLTDPYWLHGGDVRNVFSTIKYGIVEKGMVPWKDKLTPKQIQQVASFIMGMQGTNPPNGKAPQGDLYEAQGTAEGDQAKL